MTQTGTSREADEFLVGLYRKMSPEVKVSHIFDAYQMGKILSMTGLRQLHPNATEQQIWCLWAKQHLGEKLFDAVYGDALNEAISENKRND